MKSSEKQKSREEAKEEAKQSPRYSKLRNRRNSTKEALHNSKDEAYSLCETAIRESFGARGDGQLKRMKRRKGKTKGTHENASTTHERRKGCKSAYRGNSRIRRKGDRGGNRKHEELLLYD